MAARTQEELDALKYHDLQKVGTELGLKVVGVSGADIIAAILVQQGGESTGGEGDAIESPPVSEEQATIAELTRRLTESETARKAAEKRASGMETDIRTNKSKDQIEDADRLRNAPGVDWTKPAFRVNGTERKPGGLTEDTDGVKEFEILKSSSGPRTGRLEFVKGLAVTNDLEAARAYASRFIVYNLAPVEPPAGV